MQNYFFRAEPPAYASAEGLNGTARKTIIPVDCGKCETF
jgi:hypothetical protein